MHVLEVRVIPSTILFGKGFDDYKVGVDTSYQQNESDEYRVISYIKPILGRKKISDVYLGMLYRVTHTHTHTHTYVHTHIYMYIHTHAYTTHTYTYTHTYICTYKYT
ncbi:hypothetical protein EON63_06230 [archaeon]|nr:MAG: hypothetical protein EON63_06230 [archaeon]